MPELLVLISSGGIDTDRFSYRIFAGDVSELSEGFSGEERKLMWWPDGTPFKGEFDTYVTILADSRPIGFIRIELFPWNEVALHCGFHFRRFSDGRSLYKGIYYFLLALKTNFPQTIVSASASSENANIIRLLNFFGFELLSQEETVINFRLISKPKGF